MDSRVTALTRGPEPPQPPLRPGTGWVAVILVAAGIAFGYLLGPGSTSSASPIDAGSGEVVTPPPAGSSRGSPSRAIPDDRVSFAGTILASVEFGRGLVTWPGDGDPVKIRLASDISAAAYDAAQSQIAIITPEYHGGRSVLQAGTLGDVRFVASGVTGFAWHPTDPSAIAWVEESAGDYALVRATLSDDAVMSTQIALLPDRVRPVAWGSWGYALEGDGGLMTIAPSGKTIANGDVQFVAAGSDGRLVVARPAGVPLSSDWAVTGPDLTEQFALDRFVELHEHPTAAAILPRSGRIVLVSNRFGDNGDLALIEILSADGTREAIIRSGMIAESIAWSPDETRLAVGGYYYGPTEVRSAVLLVAADGSGEPIEVPFDHQVRPLGLQN